jgi:pimeloyl-ACP methyl ester carboxylesterase
MHVRRRHLATIVWAVVIVFVASACAPPTTVVTRLAPYQPPSLVVDMRVPYPILLLHGLGQKADVWRGEASSYFSQGLGLVYGGDVRPGAQARGAAPLGRGDFYTVRFSRPFDAIDNWAAELESAITQVRVRTGADRVILIGYSMGGLAARAYLTSHLANHHVRRLVTVGTPNLGSPFARVWTWHDALTRCIAGSSTIGSPMCSAALKALLVLQEDTPFNEPAVRDLRREEDGGDYLRGLNRREHPLDLDYVSIIGEVSMFGGFSHAGAAFVAEPLRRFLSLNSGLGALVEPGDGVVSAESQDVMNVPFFKMNPMHRRATRSVRVGSLHVEHLRQTVEVQRLSLEEKPELGNLTILRRGETPVLAIDFVDYIPQQCGVSVTISTNGRDGRTLLPDTRPVLMVTPDGIIARSVVPLPIPPEKNPPRTALRVTVRNGFGYTAARTIEW